MPYVPGTCLDCRIVIDSGNRCALHKRTYERNRSPERAAYRDPVYRSYVRDTKCAICGSTDDLTRDHKIRLIDGGSNEYGNLRTLCRVCNSARR